MPQIKLPPSLSGNDEIRIVSPASRVDSSYVENTLNALKELGYKVTLGEHVFDQFHQFAGRDNDRLKDFQDALNDKKVKAVFCARGGYGSVRIIEKLDFSLFIDHPKWIVGFSDVTVFHTLLNCYMNTATLHSPMPVNYSSPYFNENLQLLNSILKGQPGELCWESAMPNRSGKAEAKLVGGNLSIIHNLQSTPYEIITNDCILFIEDVGEQLYHLDRMMHNLRLSGKLKKLKGLIVGGMTEMNDKTTPFGKSANEIVLDVVKEYNFPVAYNFPAGHMADNKPFIIGSKVKLECDLMQSKLSFD